MALCLDLAQWVGSQVYGSGSLSAGLSVYLLDHCMQCRSRVLQCGDQIKAWESAGCAYEQYSTRLHNMKKIEPVAKFAQQL